jgi:Uma2 family endonuclease
VHEIVAVWLIQNLYGWVIPKGGVVGGSRLKYILRPGYGRKPDISIILPGQKWPRARGAFRKPAGVMIEILSIRPCDIRRDRIDKFAEYAAFGLRYYWILDPTVRTFEIYELDSNGRYVRALGAAEGKIENVPGCEGLVLDLDGLWFALDRFIQREEDPDSTDPPKMT